MDQNCPLCGRELIDRTLVGEGDGKVCPVATNINPGALNSISFRGKPFHYLYVSHANGFSVWLYYGNYCFIMSPNETRISKYGKYWDTVCELPIVLEDWSDPEKNIERMKSLMIFS